MTAEEELAEDLGTPVVSRPAAQPLNQRTPWTEVHFYLKDPPEKLTNISVLDWWKLNESKYPALALMVKDVLAVPIAGVGVERVFSMARDIVTYRRN